MCSPADFQIASSTHWPSWSQAPSWCGSPKSPRLIGPSTAERISRQADVRRRAGQHVAAADAALGAHQPGALQRQQDLLEVRLGEPGALGDVAHRRRARLVGVQGERQQRPAGVVTLGRDAHTGHGTGRGARGGVRRAARCRTATRWWTLTGDRAERPPSVLPDYAGAERARHRAGAARPRVVGRALPAWIPDAVRGADQVVLLVLDGLGWEQLGERRHLAPDAGGDAGRAITTVAPTTTATALTSIATGLTPGEHGLIGYRIDRRRRGAQRPALVTAPAATRRRATSRRATCSRSPRSSGARSPVVSQAELEDSAFTRGPPARRRARSAGGRPSAIAVEVGRQLLAPASGSSTPTTTASTRPPTSGASASTTTPSCAPPTGSSPTCSPRCRRAPPCSSPPTTARSTSATAHRPARPPSCWRWSPMQSGEGRFRWWHARRGAADDLLPGGHDAYGDVAWVVTREQTLDEGWFGPVVARRWPPGSATSRSSPASRSASTIRPTPGRSSWSAGTAR